jgi:Rhamnan synthesis protein F
MNFAHPAAFSEEADLHLGKPPATRGAGVPAASHPALLTDVEFQVPGFYRLWHGLGLQGRVRFLRRVAQVGFEVAGGTAVDLVGRHLGRRQSGILRVADGARPLPGVRRVALYAHYCVSGRVSAMVLRQLRAYAAAGFAVVFVTMSPAISAADWAAAAEVAALLVHRRNHGLDFGAWRDVTGWLAERWPDADELLLVNDSVLGPIRPLQPVFSALRSAGEGLFGLTDSCQGGAHLQSYFLLGRGRGTVMEMLAFLRAAPISTSKWMMVQRCEMGLSRHMHARGHRVAALFGYDRLLAAINADPAEGLAHLEPEAVRRQARGPVLPDRPLNPVHHLWRPLVSLLGFPFLKIELVRRNPGRLPRIGSWTTLVGPDSPCTAAMLATHLAEIGP